ncbi:unnamed protein product [Didymodactylos carnosus]|nr:unnamed protein product [Didymodactylos carnosus]CAF4312712.1 unnamed protein product [Didymodactylos carnosus]
MSDNLAFQFKMQTKQLEREGIKHDKAERTEKGKIKTELAKGNMEAAKIHAENAIRHHSESLNCKRLAARVDSIQSRVQAASANQKLAMGLKKTVATMARVTKNMDLKTTAETMEALEREFEDLDVKTKVMDDSMQSTTTTLTPADKVASLLQEIADEAGLELNMNIPTTSQLGTSTAFTEQDELTKRLAALRQTS